MKKGELDKKDKTTNTLMIACYESPYSKESLKMIKRTIEKKSPTKIIILKIIEQPKIEKVMDTRIGKKTEEDFMKSVIEDKKREVDAYAEDILEMTDEAGIPTEVRLRKTEAIADKIIEDYEEMEIDHLIIQDSDRDLLEKLARGDIEREVKKEIDEEDVMELE